MTFLSETVLVTRPEPGAAVTAARLAAMGWHPVVTPLLTVRPLATALPQPTRFQAVIAASGNATALPARFHDLPLLAVGTATASRARAAGFGVVWDADGTADDLAALAARRLDPAAGPLLLAAGHGQGTRLRRALRRVGFGVTRRAVYHAAALRRFPAAAAAAIQAGLHAALFFSAATAAAFARLLPPGLRPLLAATEALAIGPAAAAALRHLPWCTVRVALRPNQDGILALL